MCFLCFFLCTCKVSLAAQRRWVESEVAAGLSFSRFKGVDSLAKLEDEQEEHRLYRQVTPDSYSYSATIMLLG